MSLSNESIRFIKHVKETDLAVVKGAADSVAIFHQQIEAFS